MTFLESFDRSREFVVVVGRRKVSCVWKISEQAQQAAEPGAAGVGHAWFHGPRRTRKECAAVALLDVAIRVKGAECPAIAEKLRLDGFDGCARIARVRKLFLNKGREIEGLSTDFDDKGWGLWINSSEVQIGEILHGCKCEAHVEADEIAFGRVSRKFQVGEAKITNVAVVGDRIQTFFFGVLQPFENLACLSRGAA